MATIVGRTAGVALEVTVGEGVAAIVGRTEGVALDVAVGVGGTVPAVVGIELGVGEGVAPGVGVKPLRGADLGLFPHPEFKRRTSTSSRFNSRRGPRRSLMTSIRFSIALIARALRLSLLISRETRYR